MVLSCSTVSLTCKCLPMCAQTRSKTYLIWSSYLCNRLKSWGSTRRLYLPPWCPSHVSLSVRCWHCSLVTVFFSARLPPFFFNSGVFSPVPFGAATSTFLILFPLLAPLPLDLTCQVSKWVSHLFFFWIPLCHKHLCFFLGALILVLYPESPPATLDQQRICLLISQIPSSSSFGLVTLFVTLHPPHTFFFVVPYFLYRFVPNSWAPCRSLLHPIIWKSENVSSFISSFSKSSG